MFCKLFKKIVDILMYSFIFVLQIKKLADLGIMGIMVDKKYGGSGVDSLALSVAVEEISR